MSNILVEGCEGVNCGDLNYWYLLQAIGDVPAMDAADTDAAIAAAHAAFQSWKTTTAKVTRL